MGRRRHRSGSSQAALVFLCCVGGTWAQDVAGLSNPEAVNVESPASSERLRVSSSSGRQLRESSKDVTSELRPSELDEVESKEVALEEGTEGDAQTRLEDEREAQIEEAEGGEEGEQEGEEEEKAEFTPLDLTCGICLLSFITFNMTLYYLVNWPDPEMKIYVWTVISTTISIFISIFIFTCTDLIMLKYFSEESSPNGWLATLGFLELSFWFTVMQVSVAYVSGALEEHPFTVDQASRDRKSINQQVEDQKIDRKIAFKSVATLLAHITGFAAINAGGSLQHMYPFNSTAATRFLVPPLMFFGQLVVGRLVRMLRLKVKNAVVSRHKATYSALTRASTRADAEGFDERELVKWCLEQWDEETYESELEIAGLAISFLLVQACRFSITGVMPNNLGIEEEHFTHPFHDTLWLFSIGIGFAALCVFHVFWHASMPARIEPGTIMSTLKRVVLTGQSAFAMAFAWALFTSSKWEIARMLPQFQPNGVVSRVLLAMEISIIVFIVILMLDKLADMDSTGEVADRAIITIIGALSTLVGFSFEQSFDGAVEALADMSFKDHRITAELSLATIVVTIVYPAWRMYILRTLTVLKEDYKKRLDVTEGEKDAIENNL